MLDKLLKLQEHHKGDYSINDPKFFLNYAIQDTIKSGKYSNKNYLEFAKFMIGDSLINSDTTYYYREYSDGYAELVRLLEE